MSIFDKRQGVHSLTAVGAIAEDSLPAGTPVWVPVSHADWGHGVIQQKSATGYTVKLDEGESQDFDQEDIALDSVPNAKDLSASSRIIAKKPYGFLAAKITEIDGDTYTVVYDDASVDQTSIDTLRLLLPARPVSIAATPSPAAPSKGTATISPATTAAPAAGTPKASGAASSAGKQDTPESILSNMLAEARNAYTWVFSLKSPAVSTTLKYSDKMVDLEFLPMDEKQLDGPYTWSFWIANKTSAPISINWDKCFLTSLSGKQRAVYHGDMKSISFGPQDNTTVRPGAKVGDAVTPKEGVHLHHIDAHYDENGNYVKAWDQIDGYQVFFGDDFKGADEYDQVRKAAVGKEFKLSLALIVAGAPRQYDFVYKYRRHNQGDGYHAVSAGLDKVIPRSGGEGRAPGYGRGVSERRREVS